MISDSEKSIDLQPDLQFKVSIRETHTMKSRISFMTIFAIVIIFCSASQCHDEALSSGEEEAYCKPDHHPQWLNDIVSDLQQNQSKSEVIQYVYNHKTVYLINTCLECSDSMAEVFDCQQNVVCRFGGIAGFNTCPDFNQKAKNEKVIWRN